MTKKATMTKSEAGQKGGMTRWVRVPKKKRSAHMALVAKSRYAKAEEKAEISRQLVRGV